MSTFINRFPIRLIAGLGAAALVVGFLWGATQVGVPYQDPTPEMAAHERFHLTVSDALLGSGILLLLASGVLAVVRRLIRPRGAPTRAHDPEDRDARS